jgi:hypothetical protein
MYRALPPTRLTAAQFADLATKGEVNRYFASSGTPGSRFVG